ncbi:hypothetical protein FB451DRAFT_1137347 [Mycena latifolia]|nr:hypothetical protein FB451DRAFT_1137347 [Mycena latifolia]
MSTAADRAAGRACITDIETQISNLKRSIEVLQAGMTRAQERLDSYVYPVSTLPNEIISEIFVHFLPDYPLCPPQTGLLSPTPLTHICRNWREIALATPALWRSLKLRAYDYNILESWLSRSGHLPLSFDIDTSHEECLEQLARHAPRWEYVQFVFADPSHLCIINNPMPLLRQLELRIGHYIGHYMPPQPVAFHQVPRLRSVILWDFSSPTHFLPWAQLTSLTLVCNSPTQCTAVLQHTVNLVHCQLAIIDDFTRQPDVNLECLQSLVLMKYSPLDGPVIEYLETLIAPALRTLQVPENFLPPDPIDTLSTFISKSGCKLENVLITGGRLLSEEMCREAFPSIPKISIDRDAVSYLSSVAHIASS